MNNEIYDAITSHFENWGQDNGKAEAGFVAWAWDEREETLAQLQADELGQLAFDVEYSLNQDERYRDAAALLEAILWLLDHSEILIEALKESLED